MTSGSSKSTRPKGEFRGRIYENVLATIGATPMIRLTKLAAANEAKAEIIGKCEFFNPLGSVKDRIGLWMIEDLERRGKLRSGGTIIEPTSGNTGIALAFVCAAKGYRLILTMPETMSTERSKMLRLLGAELVLTDGSKGMNGAVVKAEALANAIPGAVIPQQFSNPANPEAHSETTAKEIWNDSDGDLDAIISAVGTGGTLSGLGRVLKQKKPDVKFIAVEPESSPVLSGGRPGPHKIQGIGAGFIPKILDTSLIDEVLTIGNETAFKTAQQVAALEGLPVGISSGAALAAAIEIAQRDDMTGKKLIVILASFAERYLSTELFDGL